MNAPSASRLSLLVGAWLAIVACDSGAAGRSTAAGSGEAGAAVPVEGSAPPSDLYDPDTLPQIELVLDAAAIAVLSSTEVASKKTWVHGSFKLGAITFADVGVRRKGESTFRALPNKASLKVKLDKWVKGQKVHGLSELTLNSMVNDASCLRERLAYHVFRSLGLPAQRANAAHLTVNGQEYGVYANIETPDRQFVARVFGAKAKTLYEVDSGSEWLPGNEGGFEIDIADPSAPAGSRPDVDLLFQSVQAATDPNLLADLDGHLHTTEWLRHSAAEALIGHYDGYAYGIWGSHNYFMAGDTDGKFSLIPWSTDMTFADPLDPPNAAIPRGAIVLARCKLGATCWNAYKAEVQSMLDVYASLDLVNLARKWHDQIDALVKADAKRESSVDAYTSDTEGLYRWLATRPSVLATQLGL